MNPLDDLNRRRSERLDERLWNNIERAFGFRPLDHHRRPGRLQRRRRGCLVFGVGAGVREGYALMGLISVPAPAANTACFSGDRLV